MTYILSLCDRTGRMVRPWLAAGYRAVTVDMQPAPTAEPGRTHFVMDVREYRLPEEPPLFVAAFPPCTHLASSGARWWREKGLRAFIDALDLVDACKSICERSGAPWMLENPIGRLSTSWRPSDHVFHPCHYSGYAPDPEADAYTKKTCLWTGGGFVMPDRKPGEPTLGSLMHRMSPSADRADQRSVTPLGFARAVFEANEPRVRAKLGIAA